MGASQGHIEFELSSTSLEAWLGVYLHWLVAPAVAIPTSTLCGPTIGWWEIPGAHIKLICGLLCVPTVVGGKFPLPTVCAYISWWQVPIAYSVCLHWLVASSYCLHQLLCELACLSLQLLLVGLPTSLLPSIAYINWFVSLLELATSLGGIAYIGPTSLLVELAGVAVVALVERILQVLGCLHPRLHLLVVPIVRLN